MSYKGTMEEWQEENECTGYCGLCDECLYVMEQKGESEYEREKNED